MILYFLMGMIRDGLAAYWYIANSERQAGLSSGLGFLLSVLDLFVLRGIILDPTNGVNNAWAWCLGNGAGIYLIVRYGDDWTGKVKRLLSKGEKGRRK
jgi:hypothetical protein